MEQFQQDPHAILAPPRRHKLFQSQMYRAQKKIVSIATSCGKLLSSTVHYIE